MQYFLCSVARACVGRPRRARTSCTTWTPRSTSPCSPDSRSGHQRRLVTTVSSSFAVQAQLHATSFCVHAVTERIPARSAAAGQKLTEFGVHNATGWPAQPHHQRPGVRAEAGHHARVQGVPGAGDCHSIVYNARIASSLWSRLSARPCCLPSIRIALPAQALHSLCDVDTKERYVTAGAAQLQGDGGPAAGARLQSRLWRYDGSLARRHL